MTICSRLSAQILEINSNKKILTQYTGSTLQDTIYIFYGPKPNGWNVDMRVKGRDFENIASDFVWLRLNPYTQGFWDTIKTETNAFFSEMVTTQNGNYKLHITNSVRDTSVYFLLIADNMISNLYYQPDCDELKIRGISTTGEFRYYNRHITPPVQERLLNPVTYNWSIAYKNTDFDAWLPDTVQRTFLPVYSPRVQPIPRESELYRIVVEVSDSLGHTVRDTLFYQAISVEANFVASIGGNDFEESQMNIRGQAPLRVQFKNRSKNAVEYEWQFWNRTETILSSNDTIWKRYFSLIPPDSIEYRDAGSYTVKLIAKGRTFFVGTVEKACIDEKTAENYITVQKSELGSLPNVFTPSGDNINDLFTFNTISEADAKNGVSGKGTRSIERMQVFIYNRNGEKVYEYDGDDDGWEGWDGRRNGKGPKVSPGVYFYVIHAIGYDGVEHSRRGFFHLFY